MPLELMPFDPAKYLTTPESQAELLTDALDSGNASYVADALGIIARAQDMTPVVGQVSITRSSLYKAFSDTGDPPLTTLLAIARALGIKLVAQVAAADAA